MPCKYLKRKSFRSTKSCKFCSNSVDFSSGLTDTEQFLSLFKECCADTSDAVVSKGLLSNDDDLGGERDSDNAADFKPQRKKKNVYIKITWHTFSVISAPLINSHLQRGRRKPAVPVKVWRGIEEVQAAPSSNKNTDSTISKLSPETKKQHALFFIEDSEAEEELLELFPTPRKNSTRPKTDVELEEDSSAKPSAHASMLDPTDFKSKTKAYQEMRMAHLKKEEDLQAEVEMLKEYEDMKDAYKKMQVALEETKSIKRRIGSLDEHDFEDDGDAVRGSKRAKSDKATAS